jgi:adenylate kinase family enzyme
MRIHICGGYGSGKTTLAKQVSSTLEIPFYSLDDFKYKVKYSRIRSVEERIRKLNEICDKREWITEGTWTDYAEKAFRKADIIVLMRTNPVISVFRVIRRFLWRKKGEKDNLIEAMKLAREGLRYSFKNQQVSLKMHKLMIGKYKKRHFVIRNNSDARKFLSDIRGMRKSIFSSNR